MWPHRQGQTHLPPSHTGSPEVPGNPCPSQASFLPPLLRMASLLWATVTPALFFSQLAGGVILGVALWLRHDPQTTNLLYLELGDRPAPNTFYVGEFTWAACSGLGQHGWSRAQ